MTKKTLLVFILAVCTTGCQLASSDGVLEPKILSLTPYYFGNGSDSIETELGVLEVSAIRRKPGSRKLKLTFMRIRGMNQTGTRALFFLEGGPGAAAIKQSRYDLYKKLSSLGDVIVLDQRGTGMSEDNLECPIFKKLDKGQPITASLVLELQSDLIRECSGYYADNGIDLDAYNTMESAHDVNELRAVLGYSSMSLIGMSYGSHLGFAILRYFEKYVNHAVLAGVEGYDQTYKLPQTFEENLNLISDLLANDPIASNVFPDFEGFVKTKIKELDKQPVEVEIEVNQVQEKVIITSFLFKNFVSGMFGRKQFISTILSDFGSINKGDFSIIAQGVYEAYYREGSVLNPLRFCMDCASGVSDKRNEIVTAQSQTSSFKDAVNFPLPEICGILGIEQLPEKFRAPMHSNVPILFITGGLDGRTPYSNVEEIRPGFPNSSSIIIENMGHDTNGLFLEKEEVMLKIGEFLGGNLHGNYTYTTSAVVFE